jgi:hypothetical protein
MKSRMRWSCFGLLMGLFGLFPGTPGTSQAQTGACGPKGYFYLIGTTPDLQLEDISPLSMGSTPTFIDSPSLSEAEYREIGTWTRVLSDDIAAGCEREAIAWQPHVWVGLPGEDKDKGKGKDDKGGDDKDTQFDLKAELFRDGDLLAEGEVHCITKLPRKPGDAKEIVIPFPVPDGLQSGPTTHSVPFLLNHDSELFLRLSARISTNDDGPCKGHAKVGKPSSSPTRLRLYYDGLERLSDGTSSPVLSHILIYSGCDSCGCAFCGSGPIRD